MAEELPFVTLNPRCTVVHFVSDGHWANHHWLTEMLHVLVHADIT